MASSLRNYLLFSTLVLSAGLAACSNIFHDMEAITPVTIPPLPEVESIYPWDGMDNVHLNSAIFISFNNAMDMTSIGADSFRVVNESDLSEVDVFVHQYNEKSITLVLPSGCSLDPNTPYGVSIANDIYDIYGSVIEAGPLCSFITGMTEDTTAPFVEERYPAPGSVVKVTIPEVTVVFNELIEIPPDIDVTKDGVAVAGYYTYSTIYDNGVPVTRVGFRPRDPLQNKALYAITVSDAADIVGNHMSTSSTVFFATGGVPVPLDDAPACDSGGPIINAEGTFRIGDRGNGLGYHLSDDEGSLLGYRYNENDNIKGIFDTLNQGDLASRTYLRIVEDGNNIIGSSGLDLNPIVKPLANQYSSSPPYNQCYIDLENGLCVLPRPSYWNKFDANPPLPDIQECAWHYDTFDSVTGVTDEQSVFSGGKSFEIAGGWAKYFKLWPFGHDKALDSGTFSGWYYPSHNPLVNYFMTVCFGGVKNRVEVHEDRILIFINDIKVREQLFPSICNQWNHVYVVWRNSTVLGDAMMRVFLNGNIEESLIDIDPWINDDGEFILCTESHTGIYTSHTFIDNWKVWKEVVSEDPSWEYNSGAGRENALHVIYGPDADPEYDYRPKLTGPDGGVGYYYLP